MSVGTNFSSVPSKHTSINCNVLLPKIAQILSKLGVRDSIDNVGFQKSDCFAVYIRWPRVGAETNWHYLGFISNAKPSAIFRVAQVSFFFFAIFKAERSTKGHSKKLRILNDRSSSGSTFFGRERFTDKMSQKHE